MIIGIIGPPGCGKTLLLTKYAYILKDSRELNANYHLTFNYKPINTIEDIKTIVYSAAAGNTNRKMILLDEAWLTADARESGTYNNKFFSQMLLQARKGLADVIYTAQHEKQFESRARINTQKSIKPRIHKSLEYEFNNEMHSYPLVIRADFFDEFGYYNHTKDFMVLDMIDKYNTNEVIEKTKSIRYDTYVNKFLGSKLNKAEIKSVLIFEEGLNKSEADSVASYVMYRIKQVKGGDKNGMQEEENQER